MVMKLVLCGDGSVGKTALRHRYLGFGFKSQYMMTIGAEFSIKDVKWNKGPMAGTSTKAQIWDLAGQQRFSNVRPLYYIGSHGALLVYDVTVSNSFENLINWLKEIKTHVGVVPVAVIGNKIDLRDYADNPISTEMGHEFAHMIKEEWLNNSYEVPFVETSAKTGENVEIAFQSLVEIIYANYIG